MVSNVSFGRLADDASTACYQAAPAQQYLLQMDLMGSCTARIRLSQSLLLCRTQYVRTSMAVPSGLPCA